ncbi:MAG: hypothetical protein IKI99_02845 [Firmicutes bacterium]|nr:hypothetical protein [Bacillota bacterium]
MKKLLLLGLTLAMAFTMAACGGGDDKPSAEDAAKKAVEQEEPAVEPEELSGFAGTKTGAFYSQFADGKMYMEYETEIEGQQMTLISATNGDKTYSESRMGDVTAGVSIIDGDVMYTIDHNSKMVVKMTLQADAQTIATDIMEESDVNMDEMKSGKRTIDGKEYDTEEWHMEDGASIMCFDGDQLAYIIGEADGTEAIMKIVKVSKDVDESLFEIPEDYQMMEM